MTTTTAHHRPTALAPHLGLGVLLQPVLTALRFTGHLLVALVGVLLLGSAAEH
jgi:hypothetical protein